MSAALRRVGIAVVWCCVIIVAHAQSYEPTRVEFSGCYGRIWKHTVNFKPDIQGAAIGGEISFNDQTTGHQVWHRSYHFPSYGISLSVLRFGNDSVLGYAVGFMPQVFFSLYNGNVAKLELKVGTGLAYLSKHYDAVTNPTNNVIPTNVNNITSIGLRLRVVVNKYFGVFAGGSFTHYSTGDARLPNLGINVPEATLGVTYIGLPVNRSYYRGYHMPPDARYGIGLKARVSGARFQGFQPNSPIFTQLGIEAGIFHYLGLYDKLSLTEDFFYNSFTRFFLYNQEIDRGSQFKKSLGSTMLLEDEFLIGRAGIVGGIGVVIYQPEMSGGPYYEQIGVQYHFANLDTRNWDKRRNVFAGVYLKTHWANAEFVKAGIGIEW